MVDDAHHSFIFYLIKDIVCEVSEEPFPQNIVIFHMEIGIKPVI